MLMCLSIYPTIPK